MTQREFARRMEHGDQWASNLLNGDFTLTMEDLDPAGKALNVPPSELVRIHDEPWELTPTEMRVVRALRMLPPVIREQWATVTDFLVGASPEEGALLTRIRQLLPEELSTVENVVDRFLHARNSGQSSGDPADLRLVVAPPNATAPHSRGRHKGKP